MPIMVMIIVGCSEESNFSSRRSILSENEDMLYSGTAVTNRQLTVIAQSNFLVRRVPSVRTTGTI